MKAKLNIFFLYGFINVFSQVGTATTSTDNSAMLEEVSTDKGILDKIYAFVETLINIKLLNNSNTFTITTGHQLNLFTGLLYFLYKIISTIKLCKDLEIKCPENIFVPIYWMATEDHNFEKINYFNFKNNIK